MRRRPGTKRASKRQTYTALAIVILMISMPWSASLDMTDESVPMNISDGTWGSSGTVDTDWIEVGSESTGLSTTIINHPPGASIENLTFGIRVNGSAGVCATDPILTLVDANQEIFDGSGIGGFGCNQQYSPQTVIDATLDPYAYAGSGFLLPSGAILTDLVIEALRPASPRLSPSNPEITIHDTTVDSNSGRLIILVDDELLVIDETVASPIVHIESINARSVKVVHSEDRIMAITESGMLLVYRLSDFDLIGEYNLSAQGTDAMSPGVWDDALPSYVSVIEDDSTWIAHGCDLFWRASNTSFNDWSFYDLCNSNPSQAPFSSIYATSDAVYLGTDGDGLIILERSEDESMVDIIWSNTTYHSTEPGVTSTISSDSISAIEMMDEQILVAGEGGVDRHYRPSKSWLSTWSTSNWLNSNDVDDLLTIGNMTYISTPSMIHSFDKETMTFVDDITPDQADLDRFEIVFPWPGDGQRIIASDGSGSLAIIIDMIASTPLEIASGPSILQPEVVSVVSTPSGEQAWFAGGSGIDRFDSESKRWLGLIDYSTEGIDSQITDIIQIDSGQVLASTSGHGIILLDPTSGQMTGTVVGSDASEISSMLFNENTGDVIVSMPGYGIAIGNTSNIDDYAFFDEDSGLDSLEFTSMAVRSDIVYIGTSDAGVIRIEISTETVLSSWRSLGVDDVENAPIAYYPPDDTIFLGLKGFGIIILDRFTGEVLHIWDEASGTLPDDDVNDIHADANGGITIATEGPSFWDPGIAASWDGSDYYSPSWSIFPTSIPGRNNDPYQFFEASSDTDGVYLGTNRGACMWDWAFNLVGCWSEDDGLPSRFVESVSMLEANRLYAGTSEGVGIIDTLNGIVVDVWTAAADSEQTDVVQIDTTLYLGVEETGIARYDLINEEWLSTWDGTYGVIENEYITMLVEGQDPGTIWAGGYFGLVLIDAANGTTLIDWDLGTNSNGPTLPNQPPTAIAVHQDILYYQQITQGNQWWQSRDNIARINLSSNASLSEIDTTDSLGYDGQIRGMELIQDQLWLSVTETQGWGGSAGSGDIARWNITSSSWVDPLGTTGNIERVNAQFLGDCFPSASNGCEFWVSYGESVLRRYNASNMLLLDEWDDIPGPIRGMESMGDEHLFASMDGILRWDTNNSTFLTPWTPGSGMPANVDDEVYSMLTVGDDLWIGTYQGGSADVSIWNSTEDQWTVYSANSLGSFAYPADLNLCDGIVHVAFGQIAWWSPGFVARYDYEDHDGNGVTDEWIDSWDNSDLSDSDPRAVACDEAYPMVYVAFDTDNVGIDRYSYSSSSFESTILPSDGIAIEPVFPGGLLHDDDLLIASHVDQGGISRIETSGSTFQTGTVLGAGMDGSSIARAPPLSDSAYAIGRSGENSGINRVDRLDPTGLIQGGYDELYLLPSGNVVEFVSNGTKVWAAIGPSAQWQGNSGYGETILEGDLDAAGNVSWVRAFNFNDDIIVDMLLDGNMLWVTTTYQGLIKIDLTTSQRRTHPGSVHGSMDGMHIDGNNLYVGLTSIFDAASGFQPIDIATRIWDEPALLAALPSNNIGDFERIGNVTHIATSVGIGRYDESTSQWLDPITSYDGLPSNAQKLEWVTATPYGDVLAVSGPGGISFISDPSGNASVVARVTQAEGLMSTAVADFTIAPASSGNFTLPDGSTVQLSQPRVLLASHSGFGNSRPWISSWSIDNETLLRDYPLDMLPSNTVTALASDNWGIHIATESGPIYHYNASSYSMEIGAAAGSMQSWPVTSMLSDGSRIVAAGNGFNIIGVVNHDVRAYDSAMDSYVNDIALYGTTLALATDEGVLAYRPYWTLEQVYVDEYARAENLDLTILGGTTDITDQTRPGNDIEIQSGLIVPDHSNSTGQTQYYGAIPFSWHPAIFTSLSSSQPIWSTTKELNYTGSWNLSTQTGLQQLLQLAVDNAGTPSDANWEFALSPPDSGKIEIRITYDWIRQEIPTSITLLTDRPNDAGDGLTMNWAISEDPSFVSYDIFLWDMASNGWDSDTLEANGIPQTASTPILSMSDLQTLGATFETAYLDDTVQPIQPGHEYGAAISIRYPDGSMGPISVYNGSALAVDNIPDPPSSLYASPFGFSGGSLLVEWQLCTDLDSHSTRIWHSTVEIEDVNAIPTSVDVSMALGNQTIIDVSPSTPIWLAASCVDQSGQYEQDNPTLFGPIVAAGGLDDSIPPARVSGVEASDLPFDDGGYLQVSWDENDEEDCVFYSIHVLPASGFSPPTSAEGWPMAAIVPGCGNTSAIIGGPDGTPLQNSIRYWVAVIAFDDWGNGDLNNILPDDATPYDNLGTEGPEPPRLTDVDAFDHPSDDGTAIDVVWTRSGVPDFAFYTIWVSEHPLDDVTSLWFFCSDDPSSCGLSVIEQRQIGGSSRIEIKIDEALYGSTLTDSTSSEIIPEIPLYVAVTVHDLSGNVFVDQLETAIVLPVSNMADSEPPLRIPAPTLIDRDPDHGDGMFVVFEPSTSPDIMSYEIYAVTDSPFLLDNIATLEPSATLSRDSSAPVLVEFSSNPDGYSVMVPDRRYFVAVVARDSSGNAWETGLESSDLVLRDELGLDPCPACPDVAGLTAAWNPSGSRIMLSWSESADDDIVGYHVYVSTSAFSDVRDAAVVALDRASTELSFENIDSESLNRSLTHYVEVVAFDGEKFTYRASPVMVPPWVDQTGIKDEDEAGGSTFVDRLVDGELNILLATVAISMAAIGAAFALRSRRSSGSEIWEISTREVEIDSLFDEEIEQEIQTIEQSTGQDTSPLSESLEPQQDPTETDVIDDLEDLARDIDDLF